MPPTMREPRSRSGEARNPAIRQLEARSLNGWKPAPQVAHGRRQPIAR
ncbi:hypothetical protein BURPSS13_P0873 [Burkholderia pseudomallei S13]|uniref:Uncharacterized protein n=1 Tax=Burkholderia pseudomallei (strain 1106a) TaxID=357348 RepID=A3NVZ9_BURP0|nr:hypothetical protein BURPS1106A_2256 [Burkholderia pseudomallei 1106a]EDO92434.1 hypothetical protein BURPSPAST_AA0940 [Burkholderia pseudomallei Pasteur 52237]EDS87064.1 hypothetical protein BURPSS13_P0873 [Burkholderia pseudomallei S13]